MAARASELRADKENEALKKLQAAAGIVDKSQAERLDWMYEQSVVSKQKTDLELMNAPVSGQVDKDMQDVKSLSENTAGSLFLKSATKTTEDMLRKLREDPLFQIRREEQNARASMAANPLIMARVKARQDKLSKKEKKKAKKAAKKEKKALKKLQKKEKKKAKSSSSSSSDSSNSKAGAAAAASAAAGSRGGREASRSPRRRSPPARPGKEDLSHLGPSADMKLKREEFEQLTASRRDAAVNSRGAPRKMSEEEKQRRLEQMKADAARHEKSKDERIRSAEQREKELEERDAQMRAKSDQSYFREMRKEAYAGEEGTMADRLKSQRHRRQKHLNDPLERDA
eukprot:TRINITY_DN2080_c0_g1_i1.p1 TRINITY_DN2080_c0_g1~~TRINITY_DN2080_c0_g1_i1.p1  ORF type:complete len:342 (+),score=104.90 TRINITY_DN2080_c0_g1_i1:129-1154(+)